MLSMLLWRTMPRSRLPIHSGPSAHSASVSRCSQQTRMAQCLVRSQERQQSPAELSRRRSSRHLRRKQHSLSLRQTLYSRPSRQGEEGRQMERPRYLQVSPNLPSMPHKALLLALQLSVGS